MNMKIENNGFSSFDTHSDYAILNISHQFTAIQQKSWHYMLLFAAKNLCVADEHKISLARLVNFLNVKSTYEIRNKILEMGPAEHSHVFSYYFEKISIVDDTVFYSYPAHLKLLLSHPCIWDVSKKLIHLQFQSKYSLFLYEFFLYYEMFGAVHPVSLRAFRHFLGLESYQYTDVKTLHRSIITQAICEINSKTPMVVSIKYEKEGAVVVGFKVSILKKKMHMETLNEDDLLGMHNDKEKYGLFLQNAAYARYYRLSKPAREKIDLMYEPWVKAKHPQIASGDVAVKELVKKNFLVEHCLAPYEQDYALWLGDERQDAVVI